jgi:hypothetical protein
LTILDSIKPISRSKHLAELIFGVVPWTRTTSSMYQNLLSVDVDVVATVSGGHKSINLTFRLKPLGVGIIRDDHFIMFKGFIHHFATG